jgi:para-aminobenzoate synthetase component 1
LAYFYIPIHIIHVKKENIIIESLEDPQSIYQQILQTQPYHHQDISKPHLNIVPRTSKETYLNHVEQIKDQILEGDVYELNYCMEFFSEQALIDPLQVYHSLNRISPMPFSVYQRIKNCYVLCASPERFLKK